MELSKYFGKLRRLRYLVPVISLMLSGCLSSPIPKSPNEDIYIPQDPAYINPEDYCSSIFGPPESLVCSPIQLDGIKISETGNQEQRALLYREYRDASSFVELRLSLRGLPTQNKKDYLEPVLSILLVVIRNDGSEYRNRISDYYPVPDVGQQTELISSSRAALGFPPNRRVLLQIERCPDNLDFLCVRGAVEESIEN